jgi:hypothetical protein
MTHADLMRELEARGIQLTLHLKIDAPAGAMTPMLLTALAVHKRAIVADLGWAAAYDAAELAAEREAIQSEPPLGAKDADVVQLCQQWALDDQTSLIECIKAGRNHNDVVRRQRRFA